MGDDATIPHRQFWMRKVPPFHHFRLHKWLLLLLLLFFIPFSFVFTILLLHFEHGKPAADLPENVVKKEGKNNLLARTVIFPRGGDQLTLDQPWQLAVKEVHQSMDQLLRKMPAERRFLTGDFEYSPGQSHQFVPSTCLVLLILASGLGNLMFQFAALRSLAHREQAFLVLPADCLLRRAFQLDDDKVLLVKSSKLREYIRENAETALELKDCCRYDARYEKPLFKQHQRIAIVNGYFQSFGYFPAAEGLTRQNFRFLPAIEQMARAAMEKFAMAKNNSNSNNETLFVGVHVRHGIDLTLHQRNQRYGHVVAPASFFHSAIRAFLDDFRGKRLIFVVASDNLAWTKRNIATIEEETLGASIVYANSGHREVDLCTLSLCNHSIISTGTFGWWAGYLTAGKVVYFGGWPRPNSVLDRLVEKRDYFPAGWMAMN